MAVQTVFRSGYLKLFLKTLKSRKCCLLVKPMGIQKIRRPKETPKNIFPSCVRERFFLTETIREKGTKGQSEWDKESVHSSY